MEISLTELYQGKATIIKNREFLPTKNYIEPFINKMSALTDDFRIQVKVPDQITVVKDQSDLTFNRILVQAVLPSKYTIDSHDEVIGLVCGIDIKTPIAKIYRGYLNQACTNLCVFNPQWQNVQEIIPGDPLNYKPLKELLEYTNDFPKKLEKMKSLYVDPERRIEMLGEWVDYTLRASSSDGFNKIKIASSVAIDAYKQLFVDQKSKYFIPGGISPTMFNIYNSFTQILTNDEKDICHKFDKTLMIGKLLIPDLICE